MAEDTQAGMAGWIDCARVAIDLDGRRLLVEGVHVPLEPKAFGVLALLAQHPGKAITRDEILDAVWGHRHITPGVLNRIITLVRQALGETADGGRYIHTVHGVGYRFDARARPRAVAVPAAVTADALAVADAASAATGNGDAQPDSAILPPHAAPSAGQRRRIAFSIIAAGIVGLLLLAARIGVYWPFQQPPSGQSAQTYAKSVAVLPLVNANGDAQQQYFADGIAESLINVLSQYDGLRVIGRGSSFRFRGSDEDVKTIGSKLGVTYVVEGSVRQEGETVRIGIELVHVADGATVWSGKFDRHLKELFAMQDEIALAVASALQVNLLHAQPGAVETGRPSSGNLEAYAAYLRGTSFMGAFKRLQASQEYARATQIDPAYAQAWAWLGHTHMLYALGQPNVDADREALQQAREEIETALRLSPDYGQAHAIHADWLAQVAHDWNGARAEFRTALALVPESDPSHGAYSRFLKSQGQITQAIAERRNYLAGNPLSGEGRELLAELQASIGHLDEAMQTLDDAERQGDVDAQWLTPHRSRIALYRGDALAALRIAQTMPPSAYRIQMVALALQAGSDRRAADAALQDALSIGMRDRYSAYNLALLYALRGDADNAIAWLQRDARQHAYALRFLLSDPILLDLRGDPRYVALCQQAGLPSPQSSEALSLAQMRAKARGDR